MNKYDLILKLINKSFNINDAVIMQSSYNKVDDIIYILNINDDSEIAEIGHGSYSCVYRVNNRVFKIGLCKTNKTIIDNSNIIKVYYKDNIEIIHVNNIINVGIEIQDLAIPYDKDIDSLYDLYKSLRDDNIIWTDVKVNNVGYFNNKLVVIDTDDCYYELDNKMYNNVNNIAKKFNIIYNNNIGDDNNE